MEHGKWARDPALTQNGSGFDEKTSGRVQFIRASASPGLGAGTDPNGGEDIIVFDSCDYVDPGDPHDNPGAPLWDPPMTVGDSGATGDLHGGTDPGDTGGGGSDPGGGGGGGGGDPGCYDAACDFYGY